MKKIVVALSILTFFASCSNYGKKVKIEGTAAEVFYKGDGVNEDDAKKTGDFLKKYFIVNTEKKASVQLTNEGTAFTLRFVYNKSTADTLKGLEDQFKELAARLSKEVFNGNKVHIALADDKFKDYRTISFDEEVAANLDKPRTEEKPFAFSREDFDHDTAGGVDFYWNGISDKESKTIADYIVQNGAFGGGTAEIYMTLEEGRYIIRFPVVEASRTDPTVLAKIEEVSQQIKENLFANLPYSFYMTDERLATVKSWDY